MGLRKWMALLTAVCLLAGCSRTVSDDVPDAVPSEEASQAEALEGVTVVDAAGDTEEIEPGSLYTGDITVRTPEASGTVVYEGNGVTVDASHADDGYVMVRCEGSPSRLKVRIVLAEQTYTYDLNQEGKYEVFPLQMGSGDYEVKVFQQVEGTSYTQLYYTPVKAEMSDEERVFVFPSQYIWYTGEASAARLSYDLCASLESDKEKADRIYDYVVNLLSYDYEEAKNVQSGYIPDLEEVLETKKGICFDYSALYAALLRAQDIPVRLVIGYVDDIYHAWNQVKIDGKRVWKDSTFGPNSRYKESDYTKEREY